MVFSPACSERSTGSLRQTVLRDPSWEISESFKAAGFQITPNCLVLLDL